MRIESLFARFCVGLSLMLGAFAFGLQQPFWLVAIALLTGPALFFFVKALQRKAAADVSLSVSPRVPVSGELVRVSWQVGRGASRVTGLALHLELEKVQRTLGQEHRATDSYAEFIEKENVTGYEVIETWRTQEIDAPPGSEAEGSIELTVPTIEGSNGGRSRGHRLRLVAQAKIDGRTERTELPLRVARRKGDIVPGYRV